MDMNIHLFKIGLGELKVIEPRTTEAQCRLGRLLHDIAKLAGQSQTSLPFEDGDLHVKDLATDLGPCQSCGKPRLIDRVGLRFRQKLRRSQIVGKGPLGNRIRTFGALGNTTRHLPADRADLSFKVP